VVNGLPLNAQLIVKLSVFRRLQSLINQSPGFCLRRLAGSRRYERRALGEAHLLSRISCPASPVPHLPLFVEVDFDFDATRFWLVLVVMFFVMVLVMLFGKFASWVIELWIHHEGDAADDQTVRKEDYVNRNIPGQCELGRCEVLSADQARPNDPAVAWAKRE
jgi:hypothetical protein